MKSIPGEQPGETTCDEFHIFRTFGWLQCVEVFHSPYVGQSHIVENMRLIRSSTDRVLLSQQSKQLQ